MKLHYREIGEGHPLIFLHGVFGSSDNWQTIGNSFSKHFHVFLVDQRNHGKSPQSSEFSYQAMVDDLFELIDDNNLVMPHILGHSMGGKTAMKYACQYPMATGKLIVVDIAPRYYQPHHSDVIRAFRSINLSTLQSRKEAEEILADQIRDFGTRMYLLKNLTRNGQDRFAWKINLDAIEDNIDKLGAGLSLEENFSGETLFVGGLDSDYITPEDHSIIEQHFSNSRIEMIPNAGHWVHVDQPQLLDNTIREFLL